MAKRKTTNGAPASGPTALPCEQRAAIYMRVSTEEQREQRSIEAQRDFAERYCALNEIPIVGFYADDGVSGTMPVERRTEGTRLLADAAAGLFSTVLVYRVDRLARNTLHLLHAVDALAALGVPVRSMSEPFDTSTGIGKFMLTLLASMAELERDTIRERSMLGAARVAREGGWLGGKPPLGYRIIGDKRDKRIEVDEATAETVRSIFRLYTEDRLGTIAIANYLNAHGVPLASQSKGVAREGMSGRWNAGVIARVLHNRAYAGEHTFRKVRTEKRDGVTVRRTAAPGDHIIRDIPPIIDTATFARAQELLRRNLASAKRNAKRTYLLRGLVKCAHCGRTYIGAGSHYKQQFYYRCAGSMSFHQTYGEKCHSVAVRAEALEALVWQDISDFARNPGPVIEQLAEKLSAEAADTSSVAGALAEVERQLDRLREQRQRALSLYTRGLVSDEDGERELRALMAETRALEQRRDALSARGVQVQADQARLITAEQLLGRLAAAVEGADEETKREVIEGLVDGITMETVEEAGETVPHITVRYAFAELSDYSTDASLSVEQSEALMLERRTAIRATTEVARELHIGRRTVQQRIASGDMAGGRFSDHWYIFEPLAAAG